ncbi:hypothetical protein VTN02DRAFT_6203 [Thermoascus thermophilus]
MVVTSLVQVTPSIATFAPVRILTGTCTSPRIAYATDLAGQLMQFPWIGCSHEDSGCCPFDVGEERSLTACPVDYTTTSGACCPSGFSVYTTTLADQTPCYSSRSVGLVPPPATAAAAASTISSREVAAVVVTNLVFTRKYDLTSENDSGLNRVDTGIVAGGAVGAFLLGLVSVFCCQRKRKEKKKKREERIPGSKAKAPVELHSPSPLPQHDVPLHGSANVHTSPLKAARGDCLCESATTEVAEMEGDVSDGSEAWPYYYFTSPSRSNRWSHNHNGQYVAQFLPLSPTASRNPRRQYHYPPPGLQFHRPPPRSPKELPGSSHPEDRHNPVLVLADHKVGRNHGNNNFRAAPLSPRELGLGLGLGPAPVYTPPADGRRCGDGIIDGWVREKGRLSG